MFLVLADFHEEYQSQYNIQQYHEISIVHKTQKLYYENNQYI